jgi:hypothetical protein
MLVICNKRDSGWCVPEDCEHYKEHQQTDECNNTTCHGGDMRKHTVKCIPVENKCE